METEGRSFVVRGTEPRRGSRFIFQKTCWNGPLRAMRPEAAFQCLKDPFCPYSYLLLVVDECRSDLLYLDFAAALARNTSVTDVSITTDFRAFDDSTSPSQGTLSEMIRILSRRKRPLTTLDVYDSTHFIFAPSHPPWSERLQERFECPEFCHLGCR